MIALNPPAISLIVLTAVRASLRESEHEGAATWGLSSTVARLINGMTSDETTRLCERSVQTHILRLANGRDLGYWQRRLEDARSHQSSALSHVHSIFYPAATSASNGLTPDQLSLIVLATVKSDCNASVHAAMIQWGLHPQVAHFFANLSDRSLSSLARSPDRASPYLVTVSDSTNSAYWEDLLVNLRNRDMAGLDLMLVSSIMSAQPGAHAIAL